MGPNQLPEITGSCTRGPAYRDRCAARLAALKSVLPGRGSRKPSRVLAGGAASYRTQKQHMPQSAGEQLQLVASMKVNQIADWRANQLAASQSISKAVKHDS